MNGAPVCVDLLHTHDCPAWEDARRAVLRLAADEGIAIEITARSVDTLQEARELRFPGSPTVLVDGRDVEDIGRDDAAAGGDGIPAGAASSDYGLG